MRTLTIMENFPKSSVKEVFDILYGKELVIAYQESQGNKSVEVSEWEEITTGEDKAKEKVKWKRNLKYTVPIDVPLLKVIREGIGMVETIAQTQEIATLKDNVYEITAVCELSGPPMCGKVQVDPVVQVRSDPKTPGVGHVEIKIEFGFNVWGLSSIVESSMESAVKKGFEYLLKMAKEWATEGSPTRPTNGPPTKATEDQLVPEESGHQPTAKARED